MLGECNHVGYNQNIDGKKEEDDFIVAFEKLDV